MNLTKGKGIWRRLFSTGLAMVMAAGFLFGSLLTSAAPGTTVYISPALVGSSGVVGGEFSIDLKIDEVTNLRAWEAKITVTDVSVIKIKSITEGEFLKRNGSGTVPVGPSYAADGSWVNYSTAITDVTKSVSAPPTGTLATITFQVVGTGINITFLELLDKDLNAITATTSNGAFDNLPPAAPTITAPSLTNNTTVSVSGTAEANSTVKVYEGATLKATTAANGAGSWATTVSLTEGAHSLTTTATDAAGNTGPASTPASVTVDITPPPAPTINPVTSPTKVSPQTITGGKSTDTVSVWVNGTTTGVTYPTSTTWSYSISLVEGSNPISVTSKDAAGNQSTAATTSIILDTIAPAAISTLSATDRTSTSITLSWTAPGDDGVTGTATSYDLRYSTSPITDANWSSATQATGEPAPQAAGSSESFAVNGLSPGTTYYFALKTEDEVHNWSGLSNVVSRSTLLQGDINRDGRVSLTDLAILAAAYGSRPEDANWNTDADINKDGRVSLTDLAILAADYGKSV